MWEQCRWQSPSLQSLSEIDFVAVLVQQQSVIGFFSENSRRKYFRKMEFLAGDRDQRISLTRSEIANFAPGPAAGVNCTFANPSAWRERHNEGADEDRFGISRSCSVVIRICRAIAAEGRALPTSFAVQ
jgi:hypothetical protein